MDFYPATQQHFDQIISLVTTPEEMYLFYPSGSYPLDHKQLQKLFDKRSNFTVAVDEGQVVGFANLYNIVQGKSAFIGNVLIAASSRGQGLGRQLTEYMCGICTNEYDAVPHLSVFNFNTAALLMYTRLGFAPYAIEERRNLYDQPVALIHMKYNR